MGKSNKHGALKELEGIIKHFAGEDIQKKIMEGSEEMTEQMDDSEEIAKWVKHAMDKLDALVDENTRMLIMENCGIKCAEVNRRAIDDAIARRKKTQNIDEFLEAEQQHPMKGTKVVREGTILH